VQASRMDVPAPELPVCPSSRGVYSQSMFCITLLAGIHRE